MFHLAGWEDEHKQRSRAKEGRVTFIDETLNHVTNRHVNIYITWVTEIFCLISFLFLIGYFEIFFYLCHSWFAESCDLSDSRETARAETVYSSCRLTGIGNLGTLKPNPNRQICQKSLPSSYLTRFPLYRLFILAPRYSAGARGVKVNFPSSYIYSIAGKEIWRLQWLHTAFWYHYLVRHPSCGVRVCMGTHLYVMGHYWRFCNIY